MADYQPNAIQPTGYVCIGVPMIIDYCNTCGVAFAMPEILDAQRRRDGESFYCPNGHAQSYVTEEELAERRNSPQSVERRRRLLLAVHEAEQAEAREADLARREKATAGPPRPTASPPTQPAAPAGDGPHVKYLMDPIRYFCPCCPDRPPYRQSVRLGSHLRKVHKFTQEQVEAAFKGVPLLC